METEIAKLVGMRKKRNRNAMGEREEDIEIEEGWTQIFMESTILLELAEKIFGF